MEAVSTNSAEMMMKMGTAAVMAITLLPVVLGSAECLAAPAARMLSCDDSLKTAFVSDTLTTVVKVKKFKKGDPLVLSEPVTAQTPRAANDLCLVKLNVGPGNPGPAGAPSTSAGIGIEVWLPTPANWNHRLHALGGGGWVGGAAGSPLSIADWTAAAVADTEGAVSSTTDGGHTGSDPKTHLSNGDFAMNPDGTINQVLWKDFSVRSPHEQAVKTKALATAYYRNAPKYSYWEGGSQGGRQALSLAQNSPTDFDGIVGILPGINWSHFLTADLYPQIVFQNDLHGTPLSEEQQDLVSNAAIHACDLVGGQHLGYIMDEAGCRYDPTTDPEVLCAKEGGKNSTQACVTKVQATVVNKIWYGMTSDGSVPSPTVDNGWSMPLTEKHRWYGPTRGTSLYGSFYSKIYDINAGVAGVTGPFLIAADTVALELQNPTMAAPNFKNATGGGADLWKTLSYVQLSNALDRGVALEPLFGGISTDNPDLSAFKAHGGKMLAWQALNDEAIPPRGTVHYYERVAKRMGGLANVQSFYKLYLVPGNGHGDPNGTANPAAHPPVLAPDQFYQLLVNWVEKGIAPERVEIQSPPTVQAKISQPICPYPKKTAYVHGDPRVTTSFTCS
jgi:feruloyl esterase